MASGLRTQMRSKLRAFPVCDPTCLMIGEFVVRFPLFAGLEGLGRLNLNTNPGR